MRGNTLAFDMQDVRFRTIPVQSLHEDSHEPWVICVYCCV